MNFDVELMAATSEKISESIGNQIKNLSDSHGPDFACSVLGNVGCFLLTALLASEEDEDKRFIKLMVLVRSLSINVQSEVASYKAEEIIEQIRKGSKC